MQFTVTCPACGEKIPLDENAHEHLISQVRTEQFQNDIEMYKTQLLKQKEAEINAAISKEKEDFASIEAKYKTKLAETEALLNTLKTENSAKITELSSKKDAELAIKLAEKEKIITALEADARKMETEKALAVQTAVQAKETQLMELKNELALGLSKHELELSNLKNGYESQLKIKEEQIQEIRDFKKKQSTKMLGENLEQHCLQSFDSLRSFIPNVYFEKDNEVINGSKGDFVYRETTEDGIEVLSILFEMKNQDEDTKTKHKNSDFFDKMDRDRKNKKCEYAVLVSMLEEDSDLYNGGIVDISHKIPKAFVVRPQFFIPIIQVLRSSAWKTVEAKRELKVMQEQERDLTNFEANLETFKTSLSKTFENARKNHQTAIDNIKKTITDLQKIVDLLERSDNQMGTCDNKLEDFTIQKITKNAPSVQKKLEDIRNGKVE